MVFHASLFPQTCQNFLLWPVPEKFVQVKSQVRLCFEQLKSNVTVPEVEPCGPIARFGGTPTIDGVFEAGEWDDAEVVQAGKY